jgi:hypothetical protein
MNTYRIRYRTPRMDRFQSGEWLVKAKNIFTAVRGFVRKYRTAWIVNVREL